MARFFKAFQQLLVVMILVNVGILHRQCCVVFGFPSSASSSFAHSRSTTQSTASSWSNPAYTKRSYPRQTCYYYSSHETEIAAYTFAFASSHIGMSAIRRDLIDRIGKFAQGWVGTGTKLPDFWPGDEAGQEIFPTQEIAGRQLYRILYTTVSFTTLGMGFAAYLHSLSDDIIAAAMIPTFDKVAVYYAVASLSGGISIASLINPSPLSLVPVYEQGSDSNGNGNDAIGVTTNNNGIRRNDSKKLQAYGLTRITRHPLILPVVPWGLTTAMIMGGQLRDFLLFGILSVYAIAGCAAQDLRVTKEEGSVGTVFDPDESLQGFFRETSFWPFQAILDSRQSREETAKEINWIALVAGTGIGFKIEEAFVSFLQSFAEIPIS
ncbi:unnamed protein product [Cylindrotheca closterium]|uniref:NnrU domain-containing protein n=1 Tax=Cylindrotheca closterium TaxID=2856 RepID=A0AAD2FEU2_9STRA|nr:unnamed protein product [Cylindrotheca closterium]